MKTRSQAAAGCVLTAALVLSGCDDKIVATGDQTAPVLQITSPTADATVSGVGFFVTASATDDVGVQRVEFTVNGEVVTVTSAPYRAHVVTLGTAATTSVEIQAKAFDAAGNSDTKSVTVNVAQRVLSNLTAGDPQEDSNPSWSPDGTQIAFQSSRGSGELNLWVMNADGSGATQLTTNVNEDRHPAWSPDGTKIAFDSNRAGSYDIWVLPLVQGEAGATNLTAGNNDDIEPAWSPDGSTLYFASSRGTGNDFNIWKQLPTSTTATQVTTLSGDEKSPAISPDGTMLAFSSPLNFGQTHIYTTVLGSTDVTPLTGTVGVIESDPAWAPAERFIVFSHATGGNADLYLKPVDPNVAAVQGTFSSGLLGDGGAAWNPTGDIVAFHSDRDGNLDIWTVQ